MPMETRKGTSYNYPWGTKLLQQACLGLGVTEELPETLGLVLNLEIKLPALRVRIPGFVAGIIASWVIPRCTIPASQMGTSLRLSCSTSHQLPTDDLGKQRGRAQQLWPFGNRNCGWKISVSAPLYNFASEFKKKIIKLNKIPGISPWRPFHLTPVSC